MSKSVVVFSRNIVLETKENLTSFIFMQVVWDLFLFHDAVVSVRLHNVDGELDGGRLRLIGIISRRLPGV